MEQRTVLHPLHQARGARIIPFAGWQMPVTYGSQIEEHHAVRRDAGMFDVSHMLALDLVGPQATDYLRRLLANDVARLTQPGKALYSCMLNPEGGVIDDLIVYYLSPTRYRIVVNAGNADTDVAWMKQQAAGFDLTLTPRRDLAMIAVQGPNARAKAAACLPEPLRESALGLKPFFAVVADHPWFVARTGYTGEDGFEIALPNAEAAALWECLEAAGVRPCGLGARDTLRLEAGMNLHGSDMDASVSPLEAGLNWTIAWEPADRAFIGRKALEARRAVGGLRRFVGLVLEGQGVLRNHQKVFADGREIGEITSGGFGPTLNRSIALARVEAGCGERCEVEIRGRMQPAQVVGTVFARNGQVKVGG